MSDPRNSEEREPDHDPQDRQNTSDTVELPNTTDENGRPVDNPSGG